MTNNALPININDLLHGKSVEWERLEFKVGWNPLDIIQTICAFANDFHNLGGGYLVIGVAEQNGRPVLPPIGISEETIDAIQKEMLNLGHSALQPAYHPVMIPYTLADRTIVVIWAPGGQTRPYKAKLGLGKENKEFGYFIRKGSSTVRARGADEIELLSLAATIPFDDRLNQQAQVSDLDQTLMVDFLRDVGSTLAVNAATMPLLDLGRQMHVIGGPAEAPFPLNVGLLFFNREPHRFFPVTQIDVVWFPDGPGGDKFTEKVFQGPIPRIVREVLDYIRRNYLSETVIKQRDRAEATRVTNFPYEAIEEAVVNAVYHRSYEIREPVEIRITPIDLVVLSFPGPDRSIRMDQLRIGRAVTRRYRNRRIGEFLKELDLTAPRGPPRATGIPKILNAMQKNGSPPPEFESDDDRSYFLVRLPVHPETRTEAELAIVTVEAESGPSQGRVRAESEAEQVIAILREGHASAAEIAAALGKNSVSGSLKKTLRTLMAQAQIEYTIPAKPQSRLQKYRLSRRD